MVSIISTIIAPISNSIVTPLVQQVDYLFNAGANARGIEKILVELNLIKDEVQEKIVNATTTSDEMVPTERVMEWMKEVKSIEDVLRKIDEDYNHRKTCLGACPINCWSSYRISKQAAQAVLKAKELIIKQQSFDALMKRSAPIVRRMLTLPDATPSTTELYLQQVSNYLQDDQVGMVGIWGMGGVGKTTLLQKINNHPSVEGAGFDYVIWVVASQDLNLGKLQKDIAKRVGLTLEDALTVESQAQVLYRFLKRKKILLMLDDIWEPVDLAKLGILCPSDNDGVVYKCKLVFTTRSETVCDQMTAYMKLRCKKIKIECLQPEGAWQFFLNSIGEDMRSIISSDNRVYRRAMEVAEKCGGLPLALVVIARAMSANKTWQQWEVAITSLNRIGIQEMWRKGDDPFPLLKVSYDHLPNDSVKKCFLCCALWPEDHDIPETDLFSCWLGMNLIDDSSDFTTSYNRGQVIMQCLKQACLLEEAENVFHAAVKMHDIMRGMALWLMSDCKKKWMVINRAKLKDESEDAMKWREAEIISLMYGRSGTLPQHPDCPNLSSLILQRNSFDMIPEGFFQNICALTYLDLSFNSISELPTSICCLLRLRFLDVSYTHICCLPMELGNLAELKYLILTRTERLTCIPRGLISRLQKLDQLSLNFSAFDGWDMEGQASTEELVSSRITSLSLDLRRLQTVERLAKNPFMSLWYANIRDLEGETTISLQSLLQVGNTRSTLFNLEIFDCDGLEEIFTTSWSGEEFDNLEVFQLFNLHALKKITFAGQMPGSLIRNIRFLAICGCLMLKNATWILQLPFLESLSIDNCHIMEHVISNEEGGDGDGDGVGGHEVAPERDAQESLMIFSNLKRLDLEILPELHSFSTRAVAFPSLKSLHIYQCPKLDEAPFSHLKINRKLRRTGMVSNLS